jgi:hypothetical protein
MTAADEAERARDYLAMAGAAEEKEGRPELTAAEYAAIGHAYATLALVDVVGELTEQLHLLSPEPVAAKIAALTTVVRDLENEVSSIRGAVDMMSP